MLKNGEIRRYDEVLNPLLQLYCIILPFEEALAGSFGSVVKLVGVVVMAYIVVKYKKIILRRYTYPLIAWILLAALSAVWSASFDLWLRFYKIYISQFLFLITVLGVESKRINIKGIRRALIAGALIAAAILIFMPKLSDFTSDGRRSIILFGHRFDPNIVSAIIMLGIIAALEEMFLTESTKSRNYLLGIALFDFVGIFFTGSRGGLISTVIACAVSLLMELKNHQNRKRVRRIILFIAIACIVVIPLLPSSMLESRFSSKNILGLNELALGSHNRYSIWISSLKLIPERPLFGYGVGNFLDAITKVYYKSCASHNLVVLLTIETGLVGLCLFASFFYGIAKKLKRYELHTVYGLLAGAFVVSMTLDALPYKFFWVTLMYAFLQINEKRSQEAYEQSRFGDS